MDFLKLLRSFEEFLFEATSWLIFYPLTLWRMARRPLETMEYSDREQADEENKRYDDTISPPLVLLATLVLLNFIALAAHVEQPDVSGSRSLGWLASSPEHLILFRSLIFSLVPAVAATMLIRRQGKRISRDTLRAPFYAQCYLAAACATFLSLGQVIFQRPDLPNALGAAIMMGGAVWFLVNQTRWFRRKLTASWQTSAFLTARATAYALAYFVVLIMPVALI